MQEGFAALAAVWPACVPALVAALGAGCAWLLLGWGPEDRRATVARWGAATLTVLDGLSDGVMRTVRAVCGVLGVASPKTCGVSLGAVSEMIDIVRLGLSAGLSFDASLGLYCEGEEGRLAERMERARLSWQAGLSTRGDELLAVARDLGARPLESFAVAVSQALELGAPLAETLEGQGREIRAAHRAEVERQIERAPVKLLIPTGTLILPALLLSILGPLLAAGGMI